MITFSGCKFSTLEATKKTMPLICSCLRATKGFNFKYTAAEGSLLSLRKTLGSGRTRCTLACMTASREVIVRRSSS